MSKAKPSLIKNTLFLFCRALLTMFLGFYTARLALIALGVEDFGLVNVVGSVVSMFAMISSIMHAAVARYYNVELARGGKEGLIKIFNITAFIYVAIVVIFVICAETVGIWILLEKLNLPESRYSVAFAFYQIVILSTCLTLIQIPYSAMLLAKEDMKDFALIGMLEVVLKAVCVAILCMSPYERVLLYGCVLLLLSVVNLSAYVLICKKKFSLYRPVWCWDKKLTIELFKFSAWNLIGAMSSLCSNMLVNVLLNRYFGVVVNAARGVAMQVLKGANLFVGNFNAALAPRIMQLYSSGEVAASHKLTANSSRYCFLLFWGISVPLFVYAPELLGIWLAEVPDYAAVFTRLILLQALVDSLGFSLSFLAHATGRMALYQSVVSGFAMMNLPLSWYLLRKFETPEVCFFVAIFIAIGVIIAKLLVLRRIALFSLRFYFRACIARCFLIFCIALLVFVALYPLADFTDGQNLTSVWSYVYVAIVLVSSYFLGVNTEERRTLHLLIRKKMGRA